MESGWLVPQKLEQIIVVALKKEGMQRDHVCYRKCYNRLFNLSKSFLKVCTNMYMSCVYVVDVTVLLYILVHVA